MLTFAAGHFENIWEQFWEYISISCELFNIFFSHKILHKYTCYYPDSQGRRKKIGSCFLFKAIFGYCCAHFGCIPPCHENLKVLSYLTQNFVVLFFWLEDFGVFLVHFGVSSFSSGKYHKNIYWCFSKS